MLSGEPNGGTAAVLVGISPGEAARRGELLRPAQGLPGASAVFLQRRGPRRTAKGSDATAEALVLGLMACGLTDDDVWCGRPLTRHRLERSPLAPRDRGES